MRSSRWKALLNQQSPHRHRLSGTGFQLFLAALEQHVLRTAGKAAEILVPGLRRELEHLADFYRAVFGHRQFILAATNRATFCQEVLASAILPAAISGTLLGGIASAEATASGVTTPESRCARSHAALAL